MHQRGHFGRSVHPARACRCCGRFQSSRRMAVLTAEAPPAVLLEAGGHGEAREYYVRQPIANGGKGPE